MSINTNAAIFFLLLLVVILYVKKEDEQEYKELPPAPYTITRSDAYDRWGPDQELKDKYYIPPQRYPEDLDVWVDNVEIREVYTDGTTGPVLEDQEYYGDDWLYHPKDGLYHDDPDYIYQKGWAHTKNDEGRLRWMEDFSKVDIFGKPTVFSPRFMEKD